MASVPPSTSQLRLDPLTGRWVAISLDRAERPFTFTPRSLAVESDPDRQCPFCPGNEEATPPALEAYDEGGAWQVRVVPNLYPAFSGDLPMVVSHLGPVFTQAPGSGIHEVLILSPDHRTSWADLSEAHAGLVMKAVRDRMQEHSAIPGLRYSQAIVNSGREAGASVEHPHAQLLGMPFVPGHVADEVTGFSRFEGNCLLCTAARAEEEAAHRVVHADEDSLVVCPYWSGTPYEMLVIPRTHEPHLYRSRTKDVAAAGRAVRIALSALQGRLGDAAYNVVIHTAPFRSATDFHWHAHLLPKLATTAGFELGTGVLISVVAPEQAATELRDLAKAAAA
jgi:UDPglucose--hexose-1-phosphate uridylyltransferase